MDIQEYKEFFGDIDTYRSTLPEEIQKDLRKTVEELMINSHIDMVAIVISLLLVSMSVNSELSNIKENLRKIEERLDFLDSNDYSIRYRQDSRT